MLRHVPPDLPMLGDPGFGSSSSPPQQEGTKVCGERVGPLIRCSRCTGGTVGPVSSHLRLSSSQVAPLLLCRIDAKRILLLAPDWPHRPWYGDVVRLVTDALWRLPLWEDFLSHASLPLCFTISGLDSMAIEARFLVTGFLGPVIPTMLKACKSTSLRIYRHTWKAYISLCKSLAVYPSSLSMAWILAFLEWGSAQLVLSTIKGRFMIYAVYFCHPLTTHSFPSIFSAKRFFMGHLLCVSCCHRGT